MHPLYRLTLQSLGVTFRTTAFNVEELYVLSAKRFLVFLCGHWDKQQLYSYTAVTDWFILLNNYDRMYLLCG